jgi:hypothetical protein
MAILAASTRSSAAALALATVLLTAGCSSGETTTGHAIKGDGISSVGSPGIPHAKVGQVWQIAFPMFANVSNTTVVVNSVSLDHVPTGAKVVGYPIYSDNDTDGVVVDYLDGSGYPPDLTKIRNYTGKPITIPKHRTSDRYAMAAVKVTGRISEHITGCRVNYTQGKHHYTQLLACDFQLTSP